MSYLIGSAGWAGTVAPAGPSPDAVAVVAQRISALAGELEGIRRQMGAVVTREWRSPAGAAFMAALTDLQVVLSASVTAFEEAAAQVGSYGRHLRAISLSEGCFSPQGAGTGNGQAPGAPLRLGPSVGPAPLLGGQVSGGLGVPWWGP